MTIRRSTISRIPTTSVMPLIDPLGSLTLRNHFQEKIGCTTSTMRQSERSNWKLTERNFLIPSTYRTPCSNRRIQQPVRPLWLLPPLPLPKTSIWSIQGIISTRKPKIYSAAGKVLWWSWRIIRQQGLIWGNLGKLTGPSYVRICPRSSLTRPSF